MEIVDFQNKKKTQKEIGGKATNLFWLLEHSFLVPDFFVISSDDLGQLFENTTEAAATEKLNQSLQKYSDWFTQGLAVRSSATHEDSIEQSMAGFFKTHLQVHGSQEVAKSIYSVWMSGKKHQHDVSVVIQKMVSSEISGVAFTLDPASANRKKFLVSASTGLGERVVSGEAETDEYAFDITTSRWSTRKMISEKLPLLSDSQLIKLQEVLQRIHSEYQRPVDVEWALSRGQFYILQVRPLVGYWESQTTILDCSNIQESYNGLVLPLTASLAFRAYHSVYSQLMRVMGFSNQQVAEQDRRHKKMLSYHQGRIYYNINSWYQGLLLLPSFGRNKSDMEKMMGLTDPLELVEDQKLTFSEKLHRLPSMFKTLLRLIFEFSRLGSKVNQFDKKIWHELRQIDRAQLPYLNLHELADAIHNLQQNCLEHWGTPIINDFFVMMMQGKVSRKLQKIGLEERLSSLVYQQSIPSLEPVESLQKIADKFKKNKIATEALQDEQLPTIQLFEILSANHSDLLAQMNRWIDLYGDRCLGELKLEVSSYRERPELFVDLLRFANKEQSKVSSFLQHEQAESEKMLYAKTNRLFRYLLERDLKKLKNGIFWREQMRLHRTRVFGSMRTVFRQIGCRFVELRVLNSVDDIFYLTMGEVEDFIEGRTCHQSFNSLVRIRKEQFDLFSKHELEQQVLVQGPLSFAKQIKKTKKTNLSDQLQSDLRQGLGCSPGLVRGVIHLVNSLEDLEGLEGKILLALRTDPGWAPLFARTKGLIIERGSALSHSVIVAREMGLPVVVGVLGITELLKNGDEVEIDGSQGTIRIISQASADRENHSAITQTSDLKE